MNKQEAKEQMKLGKKLTHRNFISTEWITMDGDHLIDENGIKSDPTDFWKHRWEHYWNDGWEFFIEPGIPAKHDVLIELNAGRGILHDTARTLIGSNQLNIWELNGQVFLVTTDHFWNPDISSLIQYPAYEQSKTAIALLTELH